MTTCAQDAKPAESGSPTTPLSPSLELVACLTRLTSALEQQTAAINSLVQSNALLIQAMVDAEGMDDAPSVSYMDGSPVR